MATMIVLVLAEEVVVVACFEPVQVADASVGVPVVMDLEDSVRTRNHVTDDSYSVRSPTTTPQLFEPELRAVGLHNCLWGDSNCAAAGRSCWSPIILKMVSISPEYPSRLCWFDPTHQEKLGMPWFRASGNGFTSGCYVWWSGNG